MSCPRGRTWSRHCIRGLPADATTSTRPISLPHPLIVYSSDIITEGYVEPQPAGHRALYRHPALGMRGTVTVPSYMQIIVDDATDTGSDSIACGKRRYHYLVHIRNAQPRHYLHRFQNAPRRHRQRKTGGNLLRRENDEMMDRIGIERSSPTRTATVPRCTAKTSRLRGET